MTTNSARRPSVWDSLPWSLRWTAAMSGCILLVAALTYLIVQLAVRVAPVTLAILVALLLTALLQPITEWLVRLGAPRAVGALAGVLALLVVLVIPGALFWQVTANQLADLPGQLAAGWARTREWLSGAFRISGEQLDALGQQARDQIGSSGISLTGIALTAVEAVAAAVVAIILLFFFLRDGRQIVGWLVDRFPQRHRERVATAGRTGWQALAGYARGVVAVASIDAAGIGLALILIGVPLVLPLILLTFLAAFVPLIGATVAGAVAVLVALASGGPVDALLVLLAVIAVQQIEGNLLEPLIMGHTLRLHPVVVLVVVTAGGLLGGVAGALVAVPVTAVVYRVVRTLLAAEQPKPVLPDRAGALHRS
jgi:putative heme transporter